MLRSDDNLGVGWQEAGLIAQRVAPTAATGKSKDVTNKVVELRSGPRVEVLHAPHDKAKAKETRCDGNCSQGRTPSMHNILCV